MSDILERNGVKIVHHFSSGVYAKETVIPAGTVLTQHIHPHDHMSLLAIGTVEVQKGDETFVSKSPAVLTIEKGIAHKVTALTDSVWYCIHATEETDAEKIDTVLVGGN